MNSRAVVGSLLTACMLTSGCSTHQPYYGELNTAGNYRAPQSVVDVFYNWGKHTAYSVPARDRDKHQTCVYFALDNLFLNESCDWYANDNSASGSVKVVSIQNAGSGHCTVLFNTVFYKGKTKSWQDKACNNTAQSGWRFVKTR